MQPGGPGHDQRDGRGRPWAVNLPLYRPNAEEALELLLRRRPPVLIASQGGTRRYLRRFQDAGITGLHVVAGTEHAHGAGAAQFGTRFLASDEATVHPAYKAAVLGAAVDGTRVVGRGLGVVRAVANEFTARIEELEESNADLEARRKAFRTGILRDAALHGDVAGGKLEAGQCAGLIDAVLPAAEIVRRVVAEYAEARERLLAPAACR